jgi:signal peptidase I
LPEPDDAELLLALLSQCRWKSWTDCFFKAMGLVPRQARKAFRQHLLVEAAATQATSPAGTPTLQEVACVDRLLAVAVQGTISPTALGSRVRKIRVDVPELMKALLRSPDPRVRQWMQQHQVTDAMIDTATHTVQKNRPRTRFWFLAREIGETLLMVFAFFVLIREGLGEMRLIPSESMLPMLQVNDRIVLEKLTRWWRPYQRGDVLVFYPPMTRLPSDPLSIFLRISNLSTYFYKKEDQIDVAYIKRLVGLPGDRIEVRPGQGVWVNGQRLNEPYVTQAADTCTFTGPNELCGPITVPEGYFFMMGDNRPASSDSRYWGFQPVGRVIGRAVFRIWPPHRLGELK